MSDQPYASNKRFNQLEIRIIIPGGGRHGAEAAEESAQTVGGSDVRDHVPVTRHRAEER